MAGKRPKWIPQADRMGCGPTCLAILTGHPYRKVADRFPRKDLWDDGTSCDQVDTYLAEAGYAVSRIKWHVSYRQWPPKPRAAINLACVTPEPDAKKDHWVVVLRNGDVLDPMESEKPLRLSDYFAVKELTAVVKL